MKTTDSNADPVTVVRFPVEIWVVMAVISAACAVAFLHYLAAAIENQQRVLDLNIRASELRRRYARQLRGEDGDAPVEADEARR